MIVVLVVPTAGERAGGGAKVQRTATTSHSRQRRSDCTARHRGATAANVNIASSGAACHAISRVRIRSANVRIDRPSGTRDIDAYSTLRRILSRNGAQ